MLMIGLPFNGFTPVDVSLHFADTSGRLYPKTTRKKSSSMLNARQRSVNNPRHTQVKYITESEFQQLLVAARKNPNGIRDVAMFRLMFEHGLRASELAGALRIDFKLNDARFNINRCKGSRSGSHPVSGAALRAVRAYLRLRDDCLPWLFITQLKGPLTRKGIWAQVTRTAKRIGLNVHPHMLRHGCGFALANKGRDTRLIQDYLGHVDIQNTVLYTATSAKRFENLWD